jgi:hypothetical protein
LERVFGENDRYGIIPRAMLEDERLGLDTRGVAAWLAGMAPGFQISIFSLKKRLRVGEEKWLRMARELENAGYLKRSKSPTGPGGRWVWHIIFNPTPHPK